MAIDLSLAAHNSSRVGRQSTTQGITASIAAMTGMFRRYGGLPVIE
jgi:hypothetical protein